MATSRPSLFAPRRLGPREADMAGMTSSGQAESDSPGTASKDPPDVRLVGGEAATLEEKVRRLEAQNRELAMQR